MATQKPQVIDLGDTDALVLDSAGLKRTDFETPIEVYTSELTGRVVVVARQNLGIKDPYVGNRFPFRVTNDAGNGNVVYFFDPIGEPEWQGA